MKPNAVVRELRERLKLTQADFGTEVGVAQPYISQVETGTVRLSSDVALRIAERWRATMTRLGFTVEDLLRGERIRPLRSETRVAS